ncbi:MAG: succinate dehydrogenase iron-sulfur subunit [Desulfobacteraceae bacterium]|jgi:succinate dehydrogenase / fumarate reductase iron-sulfur subunit
MSSNSAKKRIIKIFRYDPSTEENGHYDRFEVEIKDESKTTILDVLFQIQKTQDPTIAFRYACRVSMCGSCGMVINGHEALACKTIVGDIKGKEITLRPMNHFPIIKDLVVDMDPFFDRYRQSLPYFDTAHFADEPAIIRPDSKEREDIGLSTECIACGCCVSSCTMMYHHPQYLGPAALNRAFTLLADSRDGLYDERLTRIMPSCYNCRLEFNCTDVCPKEISPTRAIKFIQRYALKESFRKTDSVQQVAEDLSAFEESLEENPEFSRRRFLKRVTCGLGAATALVLGGVLASATIGPSIRKAPKQWLRLGGLEEFAPGQVKTISVRYEVIDGFYKSQKIKPVMVYRSSDSDDLVVYNSRCTHLGCTVHWDETKQIFLCACHGGAFDLNGNVKAGPPPRPLDKHAFKVEEGYLFVEIA